MPGRVVSRWERGINGRPRVHRILHAGLQVSAVGYRWRSAEQLAGLIDTQAGATWFDHDARGYLVAATRPDGSTEVRAPDAVGNLYRTLARTDRVYLSGGRLEQADGTHYVHDEDGRLVEKLTADGKRWAYAWDFAGQLVEVTRPDGQEVSFAYDALGRRVRKTFAGKTTRFVWDGHHVVHELTGEGGRVTWVFEPGTFAPLAKAEGDERYGVVTDHLGTPKMMADEAGALAWKGQLDVYGVARNDVARTACPWRWPGQYEDPETGLYYNRFRYYDPETGRYISQDPIRLRGGLNLFAYTTDPLTWLDPFGLAEGCTEIFRGSSNGEESRIFNETGYIMSEAAKQAYGDAMRAGASQEEAIAEALAASVAAHEQNIAVWGSLDNYVQAHGQWGYNIEAVGEKRSMISFSTDPAVANGFGDPVRSAVVPTSSVIPQTLPGSTESEVLVPHMLKP
jgi:RHS repeat-associated protein